MKYWYKASSKLKRMNRNGPEIFFDTLFGLAKIFIDVIKKWQKTVVDKLYSNCERKSLVAILKCCCFQICFDNKLNIFSSWQFIIFNFYFHCKIENEVLTIVEYVKDCGKRTNFYFKYFLFFVPDYFARGKF